MTVNPQVAYLPPELDAAVRELACRWSETRAVRRIWERDASLWTSADESAWLGWLTVPSEQAECLSRFEDFAAGVASRFSHVVLLGMGGSSLCPEVLSLCSGQMDGFPSFRILDSIDPREMQACLDAIRPDSTLFVSASKSGSTLETSLLTQYFFERASASVGPEKAASRFVAITDPGSSLEAHASELGYWRIFHGKPSIGGRYSALSDFGMVPAAGMGLDVGRILDGACAMQAACGPESPPNSNPGLRLGLVLGASAMAGRDKLCLVCSRGIAPFGSWVEQLIAESTGKQGRGILPVDGIALVPGRHWNDRVFVSVELESEPDSATDQALEALRSAGHPVVRIRIRDVAGLGQEFFRWEFATAVAGAVMGINPFDQPDVESAKVATREVTATYQATGTLPRAEPWLECGWARFYASRAMVSAVAGDSAPLTVAAALRLLVGTLRKGDYLAILAYVERNARTAVLAERIGSLLGRSTKAAVTVGFGPRFLHSTGQMHKGGPNTGVFLQIGTPDGPSLPVPGRSLEFGIVKSAQALGDFDVLSRRGRRALRIEARGDPGQALRRLEVALGEALQ